MLIIYKEIYVDTLLLKLNLHTRLYFYFLILNPTKLIMHLEFLNLIPSITLKITIEFFLLEIEFIFYPTATKRKGG